MYHKKNRFEVILSTKNFLKNHKFSLKFAFFGKKGWFLVEQSRAKRQKPVFLKVWTFLHLVVKTVLARKSKKKSYGGLKSFIFHKKILFFHFFHRINILDFFGHYWVIMRSNMVIWGHWRSQLVMVMTSFPNYYVINDFIDRTSFLGQMDWNSAQNDIFAKVIKPIVI